MFIELSIGSIEVCTVPNCPNCVILCPTMTWHPIQGLLQSPDLLCYTSGSPRPYLSKMDGWIAVGCDQGKMAVICCEPEESFSKTEGNKSTAFISAITNICHKRQRRCLVISGRDYLIIYQSVTCNIPLRQE